MDLTFYYSIFYLGSIYDIMRYEIDTRQLLRDRDIVWFFIICVVYAIIMHIVMYYL